MNLRPYQIEIIDRTRNAIFQGYKNPCIVAPCGSGKTVMMAEIIKSASLKKNRSLFIVHRRELIEQAYNTIKNWGADMDYVDLQMVQTIVRRPHTIKEPSIIITDENHHSLATSYLKIYSYFPNALRIGFTATPIRLDGSGLGDVNDVLIEGPTVQELIEMGYLAPYKYYAPTMVDTSQLKKRRGEFIITDSFLDKKIYGDVIKYYNKLVQGEKAIVYVASVNQSQEIVKMFNDKGISACHIDGTTPKAKRDEIIKDFRKGTLKVLSNVDLISEGFDVPDAKATIMLRPTMSLALFVQQAMRCMRPQPKKEAIIIDHVGNVERHGLPDSEREWSLESKTKKTKEEKVKGVRMCQYCFATFYTGYTHCPQCGGLLANTEERILTIDKTEELMEVTQLQFRVFTKTLQECSNMQDLSQYAKARGYKPGWAYYQGKERGYI